MDFVFGIPMTKKGHDSTWVIMGSTKSTHFLPIFTTTPLQDLSNLCIREIIRPHGDPTSIISDGDPRFTSHFWKGFQKALGTDLRFSSAFHPQIEG